MKEGYRWALSLKGYSQARPTQPCFVGKRSSFLLYEKMDIDIDIAETLIYG